MTKREMVRHPAKLAAIKPGESVRVTDRSGGLIVSRPKKRRYSAEQIVAEIDRLSGKGPVVDTLALEAE